MRGRLWTTLSLACIGFLCDLLSIFCFSSTKQGERVCETSIEVRKRRSGVEKTAAFDVSVSVATARSETPIIENNQSRVKWFGTIAVRHLF